MRNERQDPREGRPVWASIANLNAPPSTIWCLAPCRKARRGNPGAKLESPVASTPPAVLVWSHRQIGRLWFRGLTAGAGTGCSSGVTAKAPLGAGTDVNGASGTGKIGSARVARAGRRVRGCRPQLGVPAEASVRHGAFTRQSETVPPFFPKTKLKSLLESTTVPKNEAKAQPNDKPGKPGLKLAIDETSKQDQNKSQKKTKSRAGRISVTDQVSHLESKCSGETRKDA